MDLQLNDPSLLQTGLFINGQWLDREITLDVTDPATGKVITSVATASAEDTEQAITAASVAFDSWKMVTAKERAAPLQRWFKLIMENHDDLAKILTAEQGKILAEAKGEIAYGANYIEWFAEEAKRIYGDTIPQPSNDRRLLCIKQPIGVVACITPWNFPNAMLTRKIAPAVAAGCTVVCKTASETPLSALALAELAKRAGIPDGVINMVVGKASIIGPTLTASPTVRKLSFTGSTEVGKILLKECAGTVKKVSMELGGNAPFIIFDDADLDATIDGLLASKYRNSGQTCVCTNRVFVQKSIEKEFSAKLVEAVESRLSIGNGFAEGVTNGPLINKGAVSTVVDLVERSVAQGACILTGGSVSELGENYYQPTILGNVTNDMPIAQEEIFGPVAPLITFETEEEVIDMANDTNVGLAAYFYSRDIGRVWRVSEQLEYGIVGINEGIISNEMAPFGGVKESGMGREGSKYGLDDYLEMKYICMGGLDS
ncbi:MAG: NAD-dependent succinate-semialdehyde dehydrogenase [Gammaproteobacteria bacterium]|nr:NAD-dependent succinate-semialdehyde dehydrogenase [Gammaproteobacteria bacterium]